MKQIGSIDITADAGQIVMKIVAIDADGAQSATWRMTGAKAMQLAAALVLKAREL